MFSPYLAKIYMVAYCWLCISVSEMANVCQSDGPQRDDCFSIAVLCGVRKTPISKKQNVGITCENVNITCVV